MVVDERGLGGSGGCLFLWMYHWVWLGNEEEGEGEGDVEGDVDILSMQRRFSNIGRST